MALSLLAPRKSLPATLAVVVLLASGCGGGAAAPASSPASPAAAASAASSTSADAAPVSTAASTPSTTTQTLPDAGELQGAKLQSSSGTSSTADMPNAGPGKGPHQQEAGRSVKDIQVIVQAHRDDARACYDRVQKDHPDLTMRGNLDVKWTIDPTGKVTDISIDDSRSDIHDPLIGKCVMTIIKGIQFSVSAKGFETHAHYPFNFNPHAPTGPQNHN